MSEHDQRSDLLYRHQVQFQAAGKVIDVCSVGISLTLLGLSGGWNETAGVKVKIQFVILWHAENLTRFLSADLFNA